MPTSESLPIEQVLPELSAALTAHAQVILEAPPGAGKSTRVPLAILESEPEWLAGQRILMLEPRRLAATNVARFMASQLGEPVGKRVGYRIRGEQKVSRETRIEVITEGVLTRRLQQDPDLEGVGLVIFDEFHERSLHADTALAFALESQEALRDDLRLLIMSATLDGLPLAELLPDAPLVQSLGRSFPVTTHYCPPAAKLTPEQGWRSQIMSALQQHSGSLLVFLPGVGEIRRLADSLEAAELPADTLVTPLYGGLSHAEQRQAIQPAAANMRKVVLATDLAETSLTIEGIEVVIDAGLNRTPRFDPNTGMVRLETVPASQASCIQRAGRAGRLGPGHAYRLWSAEQHQRRAPQSTPEIAQADLAPLALELAAWGADASELRWLNFPPTAHLTQAQTLLRELQAIDGRGQITAHGQAMARLGAHPRLAHMLLYAAELEQQAPGTLILACQLAALLEERDLLSGDAARQADLGLRLRLLAQGRSGTAKRVLQQAGRLYQQLKGAPGRRPALSQAGLLLALAWPDRIAQGRGGHGERFALSGGQGASLDAEDPLCGSEFLAVAWLSQSSRGEKRIRLAAPVSRGELETTFAEQIEQRDWLGFSGEGGERLRGERQVRLGNLVLSRQQLTQIDDAARVDALLGWIRERGLDCLPWSATSELLRCRMLCARRWLGTSEQPWPDVSDQALLHTLDSWLAPFMTGLRQPAELKKLDLVAALKVMLPWELQQALDAQLPERLSVPSGSKIKIEYHPERAPQLAARLQELFGLLETPRVAKGQVAVVIQLLSPARRPVQITSDLASFWHNGYPEVKKELKGRYPKHYWPDDPFTATATRHVRPR